MGLRSMVVLAALWPPLELSAPTQLAQFGLAAGTLDEPGGWGSLRDDVLGTAIDGAPALLDLRPDIARPDPQTTPGMTLRFYLWLVLQAVLLAADLRRRGRLRRGPLPVEAALGT